MIVPYTIVQPAVRAALDQTGREWEPVNVSGSDDAYWQLLSDLWDARESFAIVEHDVIVRPDTLDLIEACQSPWCSWRIHYGGQAYPGLGCAKFTAEIISRVPNALELVGQMSDATHPPKHWCRLDAWLQYTVLPLHGCRMCVHGPVLDHYRPPGVRGSSHGC